MHTPAPLRAALGAMASIPQFFVWRLDWAAALNKYTKVPWGWLPEEKGGGLGKVDAQLPTSWHTYEAAEALRAQWAASAPPGVAYALGWMFTPGCGYWFLDLDKCIGSDGQYTPLALDWLTKLPGCFFEFSSSGTGVHVIGRGDLPPHSMRNKLLGAELYTEARGIAFGLSGEAYGCADVPAPAILEIAAQHFPPRVSGVDGEWLKPRADWAGPADDGELLRRMLASSSTAAKLGHRATFAQLWANAPELDRFYGPDTASERDAALAAHLAFWTGCDAPRMERLMRQSSLARPKWDEHRTYLRELTIEGACARQVEVLQDRPRVDVVAQMYGSPLPMVSGTSVDAGAVAINSVALPALPGAPATTLMAPVISDATRELIDRLMLAVNSAGHWVDMHNVVMPQVRDSGVPPALMPMLETAINSRLELWGAKMPIAKLRALITPPRVAHEPSEGGVARPEWAAHFVYLQQLTNFFDLRDATVISPEAFRAQYNREMPFKSEGVDRHDSTKFMLDHWGCPVVHDTMYYPGKPQIVEFEGRRWANTYSESSLPPVTDYTPDGVHAIGLFQKHLWLLAGNRDKVAHNMLAWMAHNVQFPSRKIRWAPLIKGIEGDGKSTISQVMSAAMGSRNVLPVGPDVLNNSGGFTDWAHGQALTVFEEIHMVGKDRYRLANMLKPIIANGTITVNVKNGKPKKVRNTSNQMALTNHSDAAALTDTDRRYFVMFSPFGTLSQMLLALGVSRARDHFDPIYESLEREPGQWRKWLLEMPIPDWFDADGSAMVTDEKEVMASSGMSDEDQLVLDTIADGAYGVAKDCFSSKHLRAAIAIRAMSTGMADPKPGNLNHIYVRHGFVSISGGTLWWDGRNNRVWVRSGVSCDPDKIRAELDATKPK